MKARLLIGLLVVGVVAGAVYWWQVVNHDTAQETALVLYE